MDILKKCALGATAALILIVGGWVAIFAAQYNTIQDRVAQTTAEAVLLGVKVARGAVEVQYVLPLYPEGEAKRIKDRLPQEPQSTALVDSSTGNPDEARVAIRLEKP